MNLVLFDEEEVALVGAQAYAGTLSPANVLAVHTVDQVSYDADNDHRFEIESPTPTLKAEYEDSAAISRETGLPVRTVARLIEARAWELAGNPDR